MDLNTGQRVTLFKEVLYDTENNTRKKLQVKLKKRIALEPNGGKKVFTIDIQGVRHKFHLQLDFTEQELCFMRLEELQDQPREPCCFPCLGRQTYSRTYSRLLLLLYRETDDAGEESKCVKVPLIQCGNIYSATTLKRLQRVVNDHIISADNIRHWQVGVVTCGHLTSKDSVFLCVTKYAIAIVMCGSYQIMYYHPFYSSEIMVMYNSEENCVRIEVVDKLTNNQTAETDNFRFAREYIFRTTACSSIEACIKNAMRISLMIPRGPSAHWNIVHSEYSASGFPIPGTTSDNVVIAPHRPYEFDNNNTSSSGSNGYNPSVKLSNAPPPHLQLHQSGSGFGQSWSASSNGHLLTGSSNLPEAVSFYLNPSTQSREESRGPGKYPSGIRSSLTEGPPTLCASDMSIGQGTDPSGKTGTLTKHSRNLSQTALSSTTAGGFFIIESHISTYSDWRFLENMDDEELPPPPTPCTAQSQPHVNLEFKVKPPTAHRPPTDTSGAYPQESGQSSLMRSISYFDMSNLNLHTYVNVQHRMSMRRNVHDDNPYYHYYINYGFVTMSKKLERRKVISKEFREIDFNKLENHEEWFDVGFKEREKDLRFCRLSGMNITVEDGESTGTYPYSRACQERSDDEDDPYWSSLLSLTIQKMLQDSPASGMKSEIFQQTMKCFDLTADQLIAIYVLLSLQQNSWKQMAEYIGLTISDISVIEHFCFTYRELASSVVLFHWMRKYEKEKCDVKCDHDNLRTMLEVLQRDDVRNVLVSEDVKRNEEEEEVTHL